MGPLFDLIFCFAFRILELKYRPFSAQKLEELEAAGGVLGRWAWGPGPVLPGDEAANKAGQCHSGSELPFIRLKRQMDLSVLGFAFDPPSAFGTDGWVPSLASSVTESVNPPECAGDANRTFLQHQLPFLLPAALPNAVPTARSLSLRISWEN